MKFTKTVAVLAASMMVGFATLATAGEGCGDKAEKVGMSGSCASACAAGEKANLAKGGADKSTTVEGYGLGQKVPNFTLADASGKSHSLSDFSGPATVLVFYNQNCPYVVEAAPRIDEFAKKYAEKGVKVVAIDAGADKSAEEIGKYASTVSFPILVNPTSDVARSFSATRTPEVFILNKDGVISYTGAFDSGAKGAKEGNLKTYAADAVNALLAGEEPEVKQTKAFGCSIKFAKAEKPSTDGAM
ncbi:redoxin domain-containing protein [bacterium]|nr:redoxin domain-containing protein [bacterium]